MANIIKESSIGLRTEKKRSNPITQRSGFSGVQNLFRLPNPVLKRLHLTIVFIFISLFLFVYCRTVPVGSKNHPESSLKIEDSEVSRVDSMSTAAALPLESVEPVVIHPPQKPDMTNIEVIQNLDYPENRLQGVFWRDKDFHEKVYLTFDDGPNLERTALNASLTVSESILDTLKHYHLKAVFFINGKNLEFADDLQKEKLKQIILRMVNEGHLIGNHSYHHFNLAKGAFIDGVNDLEDTAEEFRLTQRALDDLIGFHYPLILVRPPYAEPGRTDNLDRWLRQQKYYLISLQFDCYDYAYSETGKWNKRGILDRVEVLLNENKNGGLLLLHELDSTSELLPDLIQNVILKNGFTIETLDKLLVEKSGRQS